MKRVYICNKWEDLKFLSLRDLELILKSAYENGFESDDLFNEIIILKEKNKIEKQRSPLNNIIKQLKKDNDPLSELQIDTIKSEINKHE